ncbi:MAG: DUF4433 domain-containing protein [Deltaproteobacteria bacterium]|nr:DUF4433 domain-containing protein [Deltaproteobacteria bacterium]
MSETPIRHHKLFRMIHIDNLDVYLKRGGAHAWNSAPNDGLHYHTIHYSTLQQHRHSRQIQIEGTDCGTLHDYVPFYFGPRSPMLLSLKNERVEGYSGGQEPLIYLVSSTEKMAEAQIPFVFSDGHGIMALTAWFRDLKDLNQVDWEMVKETNWADTIEDGDRKRRKQAEFLVKEFCPWSLIVGIGVYTEKMKARVENSLVQYPIDNQPVVKVKKEWYY